jgi:hypothetical protein
MLANERLTAVTKSTAKPARWPNRDRRLASSTCGPVQQTEHPRPLLEKRGVPLVVRPGIHRILEALTTPAYARNSRRLTFDGMELAADAGLTVVTYVAEPGSRSEQGLDLLASWTATENQAATAHTS